MKNMRRVGGIGAVAAAALSLAACGGNGDNANAGNSSPAPSSVSSIPSSGGTGVTTTKDVFGPGCAQVPTAGAGSLDGMVADPVATAASNNPLLTKLVAAVKAVPGLADTLNSQEAITVFAPADPAFNALGDAKFKELAGAPDKLAPILKYHVAPKRYDAKSLEAAKTIQNLDSAEGGDLKIEGSGNAMTVNGAPVLCGNIPTKNATVFVIGTVLTPGTNK